MSGVLSWVVLASEHPPGASAPLSEALSEGPWLIIPIAIALPFIWIGTKIKEWLDGRASARKQADEALLRKAQERHRRKPVNEGVVVGQWSEGAKREAREAEAWARARDAERWKSGA